MLISQGIDLDNTFIPCSPPTGPTSSRADRLRLPIPPKTPIGLRDKTTQKIQEAIFLWQISWDRGSVFPPELVRADRFGGDFSTQEVALRLAGGHASGGSSQRAIAFIVPGGLEGCEEVPSFTFRTKLIIPLPCRVLTT